MTRYLPFGVSAALAAIMAFGVVEPVAHEPLFAAAPPCETAAPTPPPPTSVPPQAPRNLRIIGGDSDALEAGGDEGLSGPYVGEESAALEAAAAFLGPHDYYVTLASRSDCLRAWSMRNQAQLDSLVAQAPSRYFTYAPGQDNYAGRQDAAKLVVQSDGSRGASIPTTQQVQMDLPIVTSGILLLTWDWYWGPEFLANRDTMNHYKVFKVNYQGNHTAWTLMHSPAWAGKAPATSASVAKDWDSVTTAGGSPAGLIRREPFHPAGPGTPDQQSDSGQQVSIDANTWYRYWVEIRLFQPPSAFTDWQKAYGVTLGPNGGDSQGRWHMVSKWIASERTGVKRLIYRAPFGWSSNWTGAIGRFDFEMNTSQGPPFFGPIIGYGRNFVLLKDYQLPSTPETDTFLFQRPLR